MDSTVPIRLVLGGGSLLNQVARELGTALERQLAPLEVTSQQAALLLNAARQQASPNQLAAKLGTDAAGMTRLLDRLADKGLLVRRGNPDDRRSVVIELTGKGKALVPRLGPCFGRVTSRLLDGFTAEEIEQVTALLGRMLDNLGTGKAG
ncbi:MAG: MarR family transcriptional regulator [Actinophytocola sp.]|uniref:MarR family winged helix-turn-helix transcriptional regulator n=1 Tax=Actinophytocola sp. TaxID=1872138 RepID=UPI001327ABC4|nr:MarR family transcriptional regulator [Actinophytocola sp.]MPZ85318.1 MarR family transcriptional regulator [Actinophytocola sp.]